MRLVEHWQGSGRIVVADAWFDSARTVEELLGIGLYSVVCVKQGCKGFPRDSLKSLVKERGDTAFFRSKVRFDDRGKVQERPVFVGGHFDKQPLFLCASIGRSLPGEQKVGHRSKLLRGELVKVQCTLEQPQMHALYRKHFNAVDLFNKASLHLRTLTDVWKTKKAQKRLFAATWSWIERNAMLACHRHNPDRKMT